MFVNPQTFSFMNDFRYTVYLRTWYHILASCFNAMSIKLGIILRIISIICEHNTVYHESFEVEKFCSFRMSTKLSYMKILRWHCSSMDLKENMWDSAKVVS